MNENPPERHCGNDVYVHGPHEWLALSPNAESVTKYRCPGTGPMAKSADVEP